MADLERQLVEVNDTRSKEVLVSLKGCVRHGASSPGMPPRRPTLVKVVPGGALEAKVLSPTAMLVSRARHAGSNSVDAFPYTQFGAIEGELKSIGTLPLPPDQTSPQAGFPAYIGLDQQFLERDGGSTSQPWSKRASQFGAAR